MHPRAEREHVPPFAQVDDLLHTLPTAAEHHQLAPLPHERLTGSLDRVEQDDARDLPGLVDLVREGRQPLRPDR